SISCTRTFSPAANVSPSMSGRAVQVSPEISTRPPSGPIASTTVPLRPVSAAVLVSCSGSAASRRLRTAGRTAASMMTDTRANARACPQIGAPRKAAPEPPRAPAASMSRISSPPAASPAASSTAAPSQISPTCMPRDYRLQVPGSGGSIGGEGTGTHRTQRVLVPTLKQFAWLSVATAVATTVLKMAAWYVTGSVGLLSDAAESVVNLVAALIAVGAVTVAERPADDDHQYGHSKAEYFSAGVEGAMIFIAAAFILVASAERISNPGALDWPW